MKIRGRRLSRTYLSNGKIFGIPLFGRDMNELLKLVDVWIKGEEAGVHFLVTVNPEHVMKSLNDREYFEVLQRSNLNVIDGIGLVWARAVMENKGGLWMNLRTGLAVGLRVLRGGYRGSVVTGADLVDELCHRGYRVAFLGGFGDRAGRTKDHFEKRYKNFKGLAIGSEYDNREEEIFKKIREHKIEVLLVAYGMVRQEKWIVANLGEIEKARVRLVIGVGRTFDYYSGDLARAPDWVRRMGLEWLFSLVVDPKRWRRQLVLPKFIWKVLVD